MNRAVFLFALLAVATAEPPLRFRSRAAVGVQRPNGRFARLEEQPQQQPQPAQEQPSTGYHYPKPMSSGYHYAKPDQPFPLPGENPSTEAAQPETTTVQEQATTTEAAPPTTTNAFEDYEDANATVEPAEEAPNAKLRRRPQQLNGPSPIRFSLGPAQYRQQQQQQQQQQLQQQPQQFLFNQRLEQPLLSTATVDAAPRPVYLINLPESTLQQLILLNNAQQQQQQQQQQLQLELIPQPTAVYLSELDYVYKKK